MMRQPPLAGDPGRRLAELSRNKMLVDDHASVRSAGARSMPEGVACHRSVYVAAEVGTGLTLIPGNRPRRRRRRREVTRTAATRTAILPRRAARARPTPGAVGRQHSPTLPRPPCLPDLRDNGAVQIGPPPACRVQPAHESIDVPRDPGHQLVSDRFSHTGSRIPARLVPGRDVIAVPVTNKQVHGHIAMVPEPQHNPDPLLPQVA